MWKVELFLSRVGSLKKLSPAGHQTGRSSIASTRSG